MSRTQRSTETEPRRKQADRKAVIAHLLARRRRRRRRRRRTGRRSVRSVRRR
ncbi:hypothetical protein [Halorientalis marina]|uniref:hypothetical protein n=1 Tax=Halorientalis marina TaxID=2931976 RepID=UPI001FF5F12E|nr:hypothetical protein [Halorientalis marina]